MACSRKVPHSSAESGSDRHRQHLRYCQSLVHSVLLPPQPGAAVQARRWSYPVLDRNDDRHRPDHSMEGHQAQQGSGQEGGRGECGEGSPRPGAKAKGMEVPAVIGDTNERMARISGCGGSPNVPGSARQRWRTLDESRCNVGSGITKACQKATESIASGKPLYNVYISGMR